MVHDTGIGNLSTHSAAKRQVSSLRQQVFLSGDRLASGQKIAGDVARAGQTGQVYGLDRELGALGLFKQAQARGQTELAAVQDALEGIQGHVSQLSLGVLAALNEQSPKAALTQARNADAALHSVVSALNQSVAGKSLFSGADIGGSAIVGSQQIISDIEAILGGAADATSGLAAVDFYFNDPTGGFANSAYLGSVSNAASVEVDSGEFVAFDIRADDPAIKEVIRNLSITAAVANGAVASWQDQEVLLSAASNQGLQTNEKIIQLRQTIGQREEFVENAQVRVVAKEASLQIARNEITAVDAFEEATKFEELQTQLEMSYQVIVRMSSLSLSNFLR